METDQDRLAKAIENARAAGDNDAVSLLEKRRQSVVSTMEPEPEVAGALPPTNGSGPALSGATPESGPALSQPDPVKDKSQPAFEADQARIAAGEEPTDQELYGFALRQTPQSARYMRPDDMINMYRGEVVKDPETGKLRFASMSPEEMKAREEKSLGALAKAIPGVVTGTLVDQVSNTFSRLDQQQKGLKDIQSLLWENMSNAERTRMREEVAQIATSQGEARQYKPSDITDEMITQRLSPQKFREILDQNPEARDGLFTLLEGDEREVVRGEGLRRLGNKISAVIPGMKLNLFGAEETMGDLTGFGQYEGLDRKYEREGKQKPMFPGASSVLDEWLETAEAEGATIGQVYRKLIAEPTELIARENGLDAEFGEMIGMGADKIREVAMTEELKKSYGKGMFPEGTELKDLGNPDTWTDPNTAWPWNDLAAFTLKSFEQAPYLVEAMVPARAAGRYGARLATKEMAGRSLVEMEKHRRKLATMYGGIGGGLAEGAMIYDQVYSETVEMGDAIPLERLREDPKFLALVGSGLTEEAAKQMLVRDAARAAGKGGLIFSAGLLGTPMGMLYGRSGAGTLAGRQSSRTGRVLGAALGEPVQEGAQEFAEGEASDIQIKKIDPENPIFDGNSARLERIAAGFAFGTGMSIPSAIGALEPDAPVGFEKEDVAAAEKTKAYMDARNERYKLELKLSEPAYIRTTDPLQRLNEMQKLESLQVAEADAITDMAPVVREHLATRSQMSSAEAELKMLSTLEMSANAMRSDIALARSRRQSAAEMAEEQQKIMDERSTIQQRVNESLIKLEDIDRITGSIEKVQNNEAIEQENLQELVKEGYVKADGETATVLPKGKRALKELMRQRRGVESRLETGYVGTERRGPQNLVMRDMIDEAGPQEREAILYEDSLTGAKNRRAFNERVQNIDEKDPAKRGKSKAKAVAAVDVDNLKWVNDQLGDHATGDRLLLTIADTLGRQEGIELYRTGGDEFIVTGESEQAIEKAMQSARRELETQPIVSGNQEILPQMTWATGPDVATADARAVEMKQVRRETGRITRDDGKPVSYRVSNQMRLFQKSPEVGEQTRALLQQGEKPWTVKTSGEGDLYIQRIGPNAGKVSTTRKSPNDMAISLDQGKLMPEYMRYVMEFLQPQIAARARGTAQQAIRKSDIDEVITDFFVNQQSRMQRSLLDDLPFKYSQIKEDVQRGDSVEILTPNGAMQGVITNMTNRRGRPRMKVSLGGREFTFNPDGNWLVFTPTTNPADVAWITGDAEYAQPGRDSFPQTIADINIGHIGRGGNWYADIGPDNATTTTGRQADLFPANINQYHKYSNMRIGQATKEQSRRARKVIKQLTEGASNLPPINVVTDLRRLEKESPDIVGQINMEGASITGVRGYFDHLNPDNGLYIFVPNIANIGGDKMFEQNIAETVLHELIGHYGVRGLFGNERALRIAMHELVDAHPRLARFYRKSLSNGQTQLDLKNPAHKQLIGEEMVAYLAGEVLSGKAKFDAKQKTAWQKFISWVKNWLVGRGYDRFAPIKKWTAADPTTREDFWNDKRVAALIQRSQDFARNGKTFEFLAINDEAMRFMRDGEIFQAGILNAVNSGTVKVTGSMKKQLAQKYGGKQNVPSELPMFPDMASPNVLRQSITEAVKQGYLTERELELSALKDDAEYSFLRDADYSEIRYHYAMGINGTLPVDWYKNVLPPHLAREMDGLVAEQEMLDLQAKRRALVQSRIQDQLDAAEDAGERRSLINMETVNYGMTPPEELENDWERRLRELEASNNEAANVEADKRIKEILAMKLDQKKASIPKEAMISFLKTSAKVFRVNVKRYGGRAALTNQQAADRVFGAGNWSVDGLTEERQEMIRQEVELSSTLGYDIGLNESQQRWYDWARSSTTYSQYAPRGSKEDGDYRIVLITQEGSGADMQSAGQHFDANLMHIRTGTANFADLGSGTIIEAPNPANNNKFLSLIELQSDWVQKLRKGWSSTEERAEAEREAVANRMAIQNAHQSAAQNVAELMLGKVNAMFDSVVGDMDQQTRSEYEEYTRVQMGRLLSDLTETEQNEAWKNFAIKKLDDIMTAMDAARGAAQEYLSKNEGLTQGTAGSMDARLFDRLDMAAVYEQMKVLSSSLGETFDSIYQTRYMDTKEDFERNIARMKSEFLSAYVNRARHGNSSPSALRLPLVVDKLAEAIGEPASRLGIDPDQIKQALSPLIQREASTIRIPSQVIKDVITATGVTYNEDRIVEMIFGETKRHEFGLVGDKSVSVSVTSDEMDDSHKVAVSGSKEGVAMFSENVDKMLKRFAENDLPALKKDAEEKAKLRAQREAAAKREDNDFGYDWDDIADSFGFEEIDIEDPSAAERATLSANSVETFEDWEENRISEAIDEAADEAEREIDWDETEWTRDNEDYRELLDIDDDGDVDNSRAEEWLEDGRREHIDEVRDSDEVRENAYESLRDTWGSDTPPALIIGNLPIEWDEDGDASDYVSLMIIAEQWGDSHRVMIDGTRYESDYNLDTAKGDMVEAIAQYYRDHDISPPKDAMYHIERAGEEEAPAEAEADTTPEPNYSILAGNIEATMEMMSDKPLKLSDAFKQFVRHQKRENSIYKDTPLSGDKEWRTLGLRYLLSDAVRRGFPGIVFNEGLSSTARGGMSFDGVTRVKELTWTQETMTIQGKEQGFLVIRSPEIQNPLVVAPDKMIPVLGTKLTRYIQMQMKGKIPATKEIVKAESGEQFVLFEGMKVNTAEYFLTSTSPSGIISVFRRDNGKFVGFGNNQQEAAQIMEQEFAKLPVARQQRNETAQSTAFGEVTAAGEISMEDFGSYMNVITGDEMYDYQHTSGQPRLASAREAYEGVTMNIFNAELKKYGARVERTTIDVGDIEEAVSNEGISVVRGNQRTKRIEEQHGGITVEELTGENHGYIVVSQKNGPLMQRVYAAEDEATEAMNRWIRDTYGPEKGASEVFYIPINDAIREEFSGPVAPFQYTPDDNPELAGAVDRFGAREGKNFMQRYREFKAMVNDEWQQGMFDSFYGIKRALNNAGVVENARNDAYVQARMTTSMDSVMKGILHYGHPVWDDGIVQNRGKGLAEILKPIMKDTKTWEMYMYGKRAKRLLLEGYADLSPESKAIIDKAAAVYGNSSLTDNVWALLADMTADDETTIDMGRRDFMKGMAALATAASVPTGGNAIEKKAEQIILKRMVKTSRSGKKKGISDPRQWRKWGAARHNWVKRLMDEEGATKTEAEAAIKKVIESALQRQNIEQAVRSTAKKAKNQPVANVRGAIEELISNGRERRFSAHQIQAMISQGDKLPVLERVAKDWADFNKKLLDFAEESGTINAETRATWENADYVPFMTVDDQRLGNMGGGSGIANVKGPIQRLRGSAEGNIDILHNIMLKTTALVEGGMKNHAALMAIDSLKGSGIVSKRPMDMAQRIIPMAQLKKILIDQGMNPDEIPVDALEGFRKMFSVEAPSGDGVLSVLRNGKKEYYYTEDAILFRAMTAINRKAWDNPLMSALRGPKRFFTTAITLDPAFMARNFVRDTGGAFILGRDSMIPVASAVKGFGQALVRDEAYRTMLGAGAAFENGYIVGDDPKKTARVLRKAMKSQGFMSTVLNTPIKLFDAYKALSSAIENANRIAVYNAAIRAGKSKAQASFEAKDLMDFSMGGDWPAIQFLIQTVPFMGARLQGLHRLGRGFVENPAGFTMKATMLTAAALAVWMAYRDDERYKELEEWDKDTYIHFWIGDKHFRLPKPFELGAVFMTIPERIAEYMYSNENDAGKLLLKRMFHMFGETFSMNPIPQAAMPWVEASFNFDFFRDRSIVSPYEERRLPPDQFRHYTSPTMIEMARLMPEGLDTASMKIRSPMHMQNFFEGYTGTIGRYILMASDMMVRQQMDYPLPPKWSTSDYPVVSAFYRGEGQPRRTKYEQDFYTLLNKTLQVQGSMAWAEKTGNELRLEEIEGDYLPFINVASDVEKIREDVQDINRAQMQVYIDPDLTPEQKRVERDDLQQTKNELFREAYELRPGGSENPIEKMPTEEDISSLIDEFGVDDSEAFNLRLREEAPSTYELLNMIQSNMSRRQLESVAKVQAGGDD